MNTCTHIFNELFLIFKHLIIIKLFVQHTQCNLFFWLFSTFCLIQFFDLICMCVYISVYLCIYMYTEPCFCYSKWGLEWSWPNIPELSRRNPIFSPGWVSNLFACNFYRNNQKHGFIRSQTGDCFLCLCKDSIVNSCTLSRGFHHWSLHTLLAILPFSTLSLICLPLGDGFPFILYTWSHHVIMKMFCDSFD